MTASEGKRSDSVEEAILAAVRFDQFQAAAALERIESGDTLALASGSVPLTAAQLVAHLRMETHRIEKGFSLAEVRRPFGDRARRRIEGALAHLEAVCSVGEHDGVGVDEAKRQALDALAALAEWNDRGEVSALVTAPLGGPAGSLLGLLTERHSVRSFDRDLRVTDDQIETAARVAMGSPSVCNRAAGRVHVFRDEAQISAIFELQQGNRGLSGVTGLAVVTVELGMFSGASEIVQPWIDGGLFVMNLVWGFEAQGIGSCLLNWSMPDRASRRLRALTGIAESESVVCMLAFGASAEGSRRTRSAKPALDTVVTFH